MAEKVTYLQKMVVNGVCDDREAAFVATAAALPNGEFGMCIVSLNGNILSIYDTNMKSEVGNKLYSIALKNVTDFKMSNGFFGELLKGYSFCFTHRGFTYKFKNCFSQKRQIAIIAEEIAK